MHTPRIVSGGQTGVDRAALDFALAQRHPCGGWCPRGRLAEDGAIPDRYPLSETATAEYLERTERNVQDSDGTLILNERSLGGGTQATLAFARRHRKPVLVIQLDAHDARQSTRAVRQWIASNAIATLNVAGPRESLRPGIYARARAFLASVFAAEI